MVKHDNVTNLVTVESIEATYQLLETINKGEKVNVSISSHKDGKKLVWKENCLFVFDVSKCGNESYNAVSVVRDLLKKNHPTGHWIRKTVESLLEFH
jgi:hypothetical protein